MQIKDFSVSIIMALSIPLLSATFAEMPESGVEPTVEISRSRPDVLPEPGPPVMVRGRVTDESGSPLEQMRVDNFMAFPGVPFYVDSHTYTDAAGNYALEIPWSGCGYSIGVGSGTSFLGQSARIDAVREQKVDFVLKRQVETVRPALKAYTFSGVVRDAATGEIVAGAEVKRLGHEGRGRRTTTDATGHFSFPPEGSFNRAYAVARHDGKVSAVAIPEWDRDTFAELLLGPPGGLAGKIYLRGGTTPAAGCEVVLKNNAKQFEVLFTDTTDASGNYTFENIPPGTYYFDARLPYPGRGEVRDHFDSRDHAVKIEAGHVTRLNEHVEELVRISGRVVGPNGEPAPFALVRSRTLPSIQIQADEKGRFSAHVPRVPKRELNALSPRYGYGESELREKDLRGDQRGTKIRLNGIARVHGALRGPDGEPVSDGWLLNMYSSESGDFDAGWIPIPLGTEGFKLDLGLPRPYSGAPEAINEARRKKYDEKTRYYYASPFHVTAAHGEDVSIVARLAKATIRTLSGVVEDPNGNRAVGVDVLVYAGTPTKAQWLHDLAPPSASGAQGGYGGGNPMLVAHIKTDALGTWKIRAVPEKYIPEQDFGSSDYDTNKLTIVAASIEQQLMAMHAEEIEQDGTTDFELSMDLQPAPPGFVPLVTVVGLDGKPIAGTHWTVNRSTYTTDVAGHIPVSVFSEWAYLQLVDNTYRVVKAVQAESSRNRSPEESSNLFAPSVGTGFGGFSGSQPAIQANGKIVVFDFTSDEGSEIVITLDHPKE